MDSPTESTPSSSDAPKRDAFMLQLMGGFFLVTALLVTIGLFWNQTFEARLVNGGAAFALFACALISFWCGKKKKG